MWLAEDFLYCFEAVGSECKENTMLSYQEQHSFSFESRSSIQLCCQFLNNLSNMHHTCCFRPLKGLILVASLYTIILLVIWACLFFTLVSNFPYLLHEATKKSAYVTDYFPPLHPSRNTQLFLENKEKNSIITTNSEILSLLLKKYPQIWNKKQMNRQYNTQNNGYNWVLSSSTQLSLLRTQPGKVFSSYPQRLLLL